MFMNSVIDLTAYLPEQPAPRRRGVSAGAVKSGFSSSVENSSSSRCARRIQRSVPSA